MTSQIDPVIKKVQTKIIKPKLKAFEAKFEYTLATIRFNNETYEEIKQFRDKNKDKIGCIYGIPRLNQKLAPNKPIYILEMNNTENRIMGIGCIENRPIQKKLFLHKIGTYNRFIFVGKNRIDRTEMTKEEEDIIKEIEILCFKSPNHLKRGQGIIKFPMKTILKCYICKHNLFTYISTMFKKRYTPSPSLSSTIDTPKDKNT